MADKAAADAMARSEKWGRIGSKAMADVKAYEASALMAFAVAVRARKH